MHLNKNCDDSCPSQLQSLAEDLQQAGVEGQTDGKLCSSGKEEKIVCTYICGCAVDGNNAMSAS